MDAGASAKPWVLISVIAVMDKSAKVRDAHIIVIFFVLDCGLSMGQSSFIAIFFHHSILKVPDNIQILPELEAPTSALFVL